MSSLWHLYIFKRFWRPKCLRTAGLPILAMSFILSNYTQNVRHFQAIVKSVDIWCGPPVCLINQNIKYVFCLLDLHSRQNYSITKWPWIQSLSWSNLGGSTSLNLRLTPITKMEWCEFSGYFVKQVWEVQQFKRMTHGVLSRICLLFSSRLNFIWITVSFDRFLFTVTHFIM